MFKSSYNINWHLLAENFSSTLLVAMLSTQHRAVQSQYPILAWWLWIKFICLWLRELLIQTFCLSISREDSTSKGKCSTFTLFVPDFNLFQVLYCTQLFAAVAFSRLTNFWNCGWPAWLVSVWLSCRWFSYPKISLHHIGPSSLHALQGTKCPPGWQKVL